MATLSVELMKETLASLNSHLDYLNAERNRISEKIADVLGLITKWKNTIAEAEKANGTKNGAKESSPRRKKGDVGRMVRDWYSAHPGQGFTIPEISEAINLPHGSIYAVVNKEDGGYRKDEEGRWWSTQVKEEANGISG